eukprot:6207805-Pleurochrysis_carterae.AAC.3
MHIITRAMINACFGQSSQALAGASMHWLSSMRARDLIGERTDVCASAQSAARRAGAPPRHSAAQPELHEAHRLGEQLEHADQLGRVHRRKRRPKWRRRVRDVGANLPVKQPSASSLHALDRREKLRKKRGLNCSASSDIGVAVARC